MLLFKQRFLGLALAGALLVTLILGLALLGTVAGAKPDRIPVALAVLDQGTEAGAGPKLVLGDTIRQKLLQLGLPVDWQVVGTQEDAIKGLDAEKYYAALILPPDLSSGFVSLATAKPQPATVRIFINEGMNLELSGKVSVMLNQVMEGLGKELSTQVLARIGAQTQQISLDTARAVMNPLKLEEHTVHPMGARNAGGNAPNMLTLITWAASLAGSVLLFLAARGATAQGASRSATVIWQSAAGIGLSCICSLLAVWMSSSWYGIHPHHFLAAWMFLWFSAAAFFLLQSALLNWGGLPMISLLVLLLFFSLPTINLPPELLPHATKIWLYSWNPLRFTAAGLRDLFYFDAVRQPAAGVLGGLAGGFLVLLLLTALKKAGKRQEAL